MRFSKMHGIGNDYVYVDTSRESVEDPAEVARQVSDRHRGIGADGLILVSPAPAGSGAHVGMRIFNADGSEAEMCGNGLRCVAKFSVDRGLSDANPLRVHTGRGVLEVAWRRAPDGSVGEVEVDMGEPVSDLRAAGITIGPPGPLVRAIATPWDASMWADALSLAGARVDESWVRRTGLVPTASIVSMGNPHIVFWCTDVQAVPLDVVGPAVERHPAFPLRINVHFAAALERGKVEMRTWERGSGITLACGTGACAVCIAGALEGRTDRSIVARLPGGTLAIRWDQRDNRVRMAGPATHVFDGEWRR